jgi:hypothetical protein
MDRLSPEAADRLAAAERAAAALRALDELARLLNPDGELGRWATAGAIRDRLVRFEDTAWPRIRSGKRPTRDRIEDLLCALARCSERQIPRTRDRLSKLLGTDAHRRKKPARLGSIDYPEPD